MSPDNSELARSTSWKITLNIVLPVFLTSIIAYLDRNNLSYAKLTMNQDLGFSEAAYGFGAGIFFLGYLLFEIPGAIIAETWSARLWLARILLTWGVLTGLMALVTSEWQFYLVRFLIGAAEASLYPVIYATVIPRWFAPADRARAIAIVLSSLQISAIIGAPLAGWLIDCPLGPLKGWQVLFLLEALPAIVLGCVIAGWMADTPATAWWLSTDERNYLQQSLSAATDSIPHQRLSLATALAHPEVLKLCAIYFLWMTGYWGFNYYTPTLLKGHGWSNQAVGWLMAAAMTLSLIVMLLVGHSSSVTGEKRWHGALGLFAAAIGMGLGTLAAVPSAAPFVAFGWLCLAGIGVYAPLGVWWSYPTTFLRGTAAAGAIGLINSVGSAGGFVGPYLTGFLKERTGSYAGAWSYLAIALGVSGCLILLLRRPTSPDKSAEDHARTTN